MSAQEAFYVEMLAGDPDAAERIARELRDARADGRAGLPLDGGRAARARALGAGELDEAERFSRTSEEAAAPDDAFSQVLWRSARAKIRARRGELDEAEALAREAVALAERTDLLNTHGDTLADLAEVIALAGRPAEAVAVYEQAAEIFERKGNLASLERVRVAAQGLARVTYDVLVLGGGAAGCALAGRLSENPDRTVCLVEAGPDYGHLSEGRWPAGHPRPALARARVAPLGARPTRTTARSRGPGSSAAARRTTPACCSRARPPTTTWGGGLVVRGVRAVPAPRVRDAARPRARATRS